MPRHVDSWQKAVDWQTLMRVLPLHLKKKAPRLSSHEVEDVAGETFAAAIATFDPGLGRFEPWLFRIARTKLADCFRARRPSEMAFDCTSIASHSPGPEQQVVAAIRVQELRHEVSEEPELMRLVNTIEGESSTKPRELARALSIPVTRVNKLKQRLRHHLRRRDL